TILIQDKDEKNETQKQIPIPIDSKSLNIRLEKIKTVDYNYPNFSNPIRYIFLVHSDDGTISVSLSFVSGTDSTKFLPQDSSLPVGIDHHIIPLSYRPPD